MSRFGKSMVVNMLVAYYGKNNPRSVVMSLIEHLGYVTYDFYNQTVTIPNQEVQMNCFQPH